MLRFVVFTVLVASAFAGYGSSYGGSSYGSGSYGGSYSSVVPAAVQSRRSLSYIDVPSTYEAPSPLTIDVPASAQPLNFLLRSKSSPINLETAHEGQQGSYAETSSIDEPHVRAHTVQRPIIHQVNEIISPYRKIQQQVQPVQENVEQVVARGYAQPQPQLQYQPVQTLRLVQLQQQPLLQLVQPSYGKSGGY